jgi:hypothetical protein
MTATFELVYEKRPAFGTLSAAMEEDVCSRRCRVRDSEPIVSDASPIAWQVFEGVVESDDVINRNLRHSLRLRETQIHRDLAPTLRARFSLSPIGHAAARGAEMKLGPPR